MSSQSSKENTASENLLMFGLLCKDAGAGVQLEKEDIKDEPESISQFNNNLDVDGGTKVENWQCCYVKAEHDIISIYPEESNSQFIDDKMKAEGSFRLPKLCQESYQDVSNCDTDDMNCNGPNPPVCVDPEDNEGGQDNHNVDPHEMRLSTSSNQALSDDMTRQPTTRSGQGSNWRLGHAEKSHTTGINTPVACTDTPVSPTSKHTTTIYTEDRPHECETCGKRFSQKSHLKIHIRTHTGDKPHKCIACGKCFPCKSSFQVHARTHKEKLHNCDTCEEISQKSQLEKHAMTHGSEERPFECVTCRKGFYREYDLQQHTQIHTGENPYECGVCGKDFACKSALLGHSKAHTIDKPYGCVTCGEDFSRKSQWEKHIVIHTGEKPHKCVTCGKKFSREYNLLQHIRVHTGDRPFECGICGNDFTCKSSLQTHVRTHSRGKEKPFECGICGNHFSCRSHLQSHIMTHTGEKSFECDTCGKGFYRNSNLQRHVKTHVGKKKYRYCMTKCLAL